MDLTTSLAELRGGGRDNLGTCWVELSVNTTVRPAGVKPYTRSLVTVYLGQKLTRPLLYREENTWRRPLEIAGHSVTGVNDSTEILTHCTNKNTNEQKVK